ncbi:hypothetical protein [Xenorhabdus budapestensis]|uniref:Uncharacterized protein n=1 Tax=Xenorhabdus budapestensis TaxID=290110 RepID=A0A2D0ILB7_XENBU|nr:hypothetical protein [Xenorhabdus budapestensis]PHM22605.1 hypothetical protein Xbud_03737 [Xenorhabdus budapestensis]
MIKEQCEYDDYFIYNKSLIDFLMDFELPDRIYLNNADSFDDKYISTQENYWVYDYSGCRHCVRFNLDKNSNQLLKFICFHYASTRSPYQLPSLQQAWVKAIDYCKEQESFTFSVLKDYLETDDLDPRCFYYILYGVKILCINELSDFSLNNYDELEFIPRPISHSWGIYKEIDNMLDPNEKNMISNGLFELADAIKNGKIIKKDTLKNAAMLGIIYATSARPVQISKLAAKYIHIDTRDSTNNVTRYSIILTLR